LPRALDRQQLSGVALVSVLVLLAVYFLVLHEPGPDPHAKAEPASSAPAH
jgi:hypothetical protein